MFQINSCYFHYFWNLERQTYVFKYHKTPLNALNGFDILVNLINTLISDTFHKRYRQKDKGGVRSYIHRRMHTRKKHNRSELLHANTYIRSHNIDTLSAHIVFQYTLFENTNYALYYFFTLNIFKLINTFALQYFCNERKSCLATLKRVLSP